VPHESRTHTNTHLYSERQGTLDGTVTRQPRTPPFTTAGLIDYVVELVVSEDDVRLPFPSRAALTTIQAIQLVDRVAFRRLLVYLRPSLTDKDIPHRTRLRTEIVNRAKAAQESVKEKLKVRFVTRHLCVILISHHSEYTRSCIIHIRHLDFWQRRPLSLNNQTLC
jgi:hypothetical protein